MKKLLLSALILITSFGLKAQENLALTFDNAAITNDGFDDFYEADVFVTRTTVDFKMGSGQFYVDYNPLAFGMSIGDATVDFTYPAGSVLGEEIFPGAGIYLAPVINANTNGVVSISWQQGLKGGAIAADNVTNTPALLGHLKIQMINTAESPDICFNVVGTNFDDQFYTACGPFTPGFGFPDCAGEPGTQIINYDGSDCTGAIIPMGCALKTWDGVNWSPAGAPTAADNVVIADAYNTATDGGSITACEITVNTGVLLNIAADDFLSVVNDITVNGFLLVEPTANVVQINDMAAVNKVGQINVFVTTPALDGRDFMLMGSPMTGETRAGVFAGALRVRNHLTANFTPNAAVVAATNGAGVWVDQEGDDWSIYTASFIDAGEGYMVMRDLTGPATALNLDFTQGTLNNGVVTYNAGFNDSQNASPNIIANPYASAMSATDLINGNANVDAVYFWEHITAPSAGTPGPYGLDYTMEDISIFNLTGGTAAAGSGGTVPNGIISTGQGFGVKASAAGSITFNNAMRRTSGNTTLRNQDLDRIWLNVQSNGYELNSTALLGFMEEATDGIDIGYDAKRLATNVSLYTHLADGTDQLGIQARGLFDENVKIPMGFATLIDEQMTYTISIQNVEGLNLANATVYLIDNTLNTITNLNNENYTFDSEKGIFDGRFTLQFTPEGILGTSNNLLETVAVYPNPTQNILNIVSPKTVVTNISVFDISGRSVMTEAFTNSGNVQIDLTELNSAVYFVEINTEAGKVTKRVIKQ